jgi:hypothetical protein
MKAISKNLNIILLHEPLDEVFNAKIIKDNKEFLGIVGAISKKGTCQFDLKGISPGDNLSISYFDKETKEPLDFSIEYISIS